MQEFPRLLRYILEREVHFTMLKRFFCCVLLLCCVLSAASAEYRYVYNGTQWDARLNLRAEPTKNSTSIGRYYTGVRVQVLEDLGEWSRVRIAMGESEKAVEGYMMNGYLVSGLRGAGMLPYGHYNGKRAYVMAYNSSNLHLLYEDGSTGYFLTNKASFVKPLDEERLVIERICTAEGGAQLMDSAGAAVCTLYGGVTLEGMIFAGRTRALAALGDENGEVSGVIDQPAWTWMDNGANCEEQYAVYEGEGGLVEVLGKMADGRTILRMTTNGIDAPQVVLSSGFHLMGLTPLQREGSYFRYTRPLLDEHTDDALISSVYNQLDETHLQKLSGCTARVDRLIDFQYGHRMLRVTFVDAAGQVVGMADLDGAVMIWQWGDNG